MKVVMTDLIILVRMCRREVGDTTVLIDKYPPFLQELVELQALAAAQQPEYDRSLEELCGLHEDFSLFTLTERGTARWEEILGIARQCGDTLPIRRARIQTVYLSRLPYTGRALEDYLRQVSEQYTLQLDTANYQLYVDVLLDGYDRRAALLAVLAEMLPANIALQLLSMIRETVAASPVIPAAVVTTEVRHIHQPQGGVKNGQMATAERPAARHRSQL